MNLLQLCLPCFCARFLPTLMHESLANISRGWSRRSITASCSSLAGVLGSAGQALAAPTSSTCTGMWQQPQQSSGTLPPAQRVLRAWSRGTLASQQPHAHRGSPKAGICRALQGKPVPRHRHCLLLDENGWHLPPWAELPTHWYPSRRAKASSQCGLTNKGT